MLTTLVSMICALNMSAVAPVVSAADTVDIYVIDKEKIEKFDGSQLKDKTILSYTITLSEGIRTHNITTLQGSKKPAVSYPKRKVIYVVNGKEVTEKELIAVKPDNIKEMKVIKNPDSPEARKYNSGLGASVIIVTTK